MAHMFRRRAVLLLASVSLLLLVGSARADHLNGNGVTVIDADQLKAWVDQGKKMLVVDARVVPEYREGHIPGAVSVPEPTMEKHRDKFPKDLTYPIVFYCNGWPECKKSHEACAKALQWGFQQVYWFRDGIPAWQAKGYPVE